MGGGFWRYSLRSVIATSASSDVARDDDRQLQVADRLLEALAADAVREHPQRRQRAALDLAHGRPVAVLLPVVALVVERGPVDIGLARDHSGDAGLLLRLELVGVDGARALVLAQRVQGAGRLLAPGLLALQLAGVPGADVDDRRGGRTLGPLQRPAIGDLARDERRAGRGLDRADRPAGWRTARRAGRSARPVGPPPWTAGRGPMSRRGPTSRRRSGRIASRPTGPA